MNKYQEAYEKAHWSEHTSEWHEAMRDIKELVNRATPMKPIRVQKLVKQTECVTRLYLNVPTCPICGSVLDEDECCKNNDCRQAIDWSE